MQECIIVGRPNSGKTTFALNFANYMGCNCFNITFMPPDGNVFTQKYSLREARNTLCGMFGYKTRCLQYWNVDLNKKQFITLKDTCSLSHKIPDNIEIRRGVAQTIHIIRNCSRIVHVIDACRLNEDFFSNSENIDLAIYQYGIACKRYMLIINKVDLKPLTITHGRLTNLFPSVNIIPVSALYYRGFKAIKNIFTASL